MASLGGVWDATKYPPSIEETMQELRQLATVETPQSFMALHGSTLIENGYNILPIIPNQKIPGRLSNGTWLPMEGWQQFCERQPTEAEINLWASWPECGIGLACGNVIGIDVDILDAAVAMELEKLARTMLGDTPTLRIGRFPKRALYYRADKPFNGRKLHPLEVYGLGSQMVIAGVHPVTRNAYEWPNESLVELDVSRLPVITEAQAMAWLSEAFKQVPDELKPKRLNGDTASSSLERQSGDPKGTLDAIKSALAFLPNDDLDGTSWVVMLNALKASLGEQGRDLWLDWSKSSSKSGASGKSDTAEKRWRTARPRNVGAGTIYYMAQQRGWVPPDGVILNGDAAEWAKGPSPAAAIIANGNSLARGNATPMKPRKLKYLWAGNIRPRLFAGGTLVKGLLDQGAMSVVYAPSNAGKSFFVLDLALHVAMGWDWRGHKVKARGAVVYIAAEGGNGFANRVAALRQHHAIPDGAECPLAVVPSPIDLLDPKADLEHILALIGDVEAEAGMPVVMVIIDTLSRAMAGGDENSSKDMTSFVANVDTIRQANASPHLMVIHHAGKDIAKGARGHSSLRAATDSEFEIAKKEPDNSADKRATAFVKKQRDMPGGEEFEFDLATVTLGEDEDGDPVTSAVVIPEWAGKSLVEKLGREGELRETKQFTSLALLVDLIQDTGEWVVDPNVPTGTRAVLATAWRDAMAANGIISGATNEGLRKPFERIRDKLSGEGSVQTYGKYVWIARREG